MQDKEIHALLDSFCITDKELLSRNLLKEFIHSFCDIIIDELHKTHLKNNPNLAIYLSHTDGSMLLKKMKLFMAFVLVEPINEQYIQKIYQVGFTHYKIRLEPAKVSYAFWALNEIINTLAQTNSLVKEHKTFISKLLRFVEHVMNDGYSLQKEKQLLNVSHEREETNIQSELYTGFNLHKLNVKKIELAIHSQDNHQLLNDISESNSTCSFGKILQKIQNDKKYITLLGTSASEINDLHRQWHLSFTKVKKAILLQNIDDILLHHQAIKKFTLELSALLDANLQVSLEDGQLSLRASMKSMNKMTKLFYEKDYKNVKKNSIKKVLQKAVESAILSEFSWAIEQTQIQEATTPLTKTNSITKLIRYNGESFYIVIDLKQQQDTSYIHEMLHLLLEVLEMHFYVQERELSLITFADDAEKANKSKDMFLANMSHELRTPINAITGFSQILLMKKDTPEKVKNYVEKINIAGNNLLELVNTILDFAKLESGKMQFQPSLSNIANIIKEVYTLVSPMAQKKSLKLLMPSIVSLNLYIDSTLFKQVLINLLTNAIKFTPEHGKISLSVQYNEMKRSYTFEVKDTGVGLSEEEMRRLFQAFSQIDNKYHKEHKGSGLGLMISKSIIEELHKGEIWVESEKGKGSSFFVAMPTPNVESHTQHIKNAPKNAQNILIVEDSQEYQKVLIGNLQETHNITLTDTVNRAKELLHTNSYDFLILDFFLSDGISSEILTFMEEEKISIPVLVISAEDEIHISKSLSGFSNLQCILNKKDVHKICASLRGESIKELSCSQ